MRSYFVFLLLFLPFLGKGTEVDLSEIAKENPDSLLEASQYALIKSINPVEKANLYHTIGLCQIELNDTKSAIKSFEIEAELLHKYAKDNIQLEVENKLALSECYYAIGALISADSILQLTYQSLPKIKDYSLQITVLLKTGWLSRERGRHSEALGYYLDAELIADKNRDEIQLANTYGRIAVVYHVMEDYKTAERYYNQALELYQKLGLKEEEGRLYNNYGLLYQHKNIPVKAIYYYEKSIKMCEEIGNIRGAAIANENLGTVCFEYLKNNTVALDHFDYSVSVWREAGDIYGESQTLVYKLNVYLDQEDYKKVVDTAHLALDLARKSGAKDVEKDVLLQLSKGYKGINKINEAYYYYQAYVSLKDSLDEINNFEKISLMSQRLELQKEHVQDSLKMVIDYNENKAIVESQFKEQRFWTIILSIAFFALMVILVMVIRGRRAQLKSAKIIAETNIILQTKNREIIDSITYAKNIQESILPTNEDIERLFPNHFLYYQPKDIVAGDFYWIQQIKTENSTYNFVAVADCTGHGVPGAMVSIVCANALNKSVKEMKLTQPSKILEEVNTIVRENFSKGTHQLNDGMDICLLAVREINNHQFEVQYAGANNPLWFIRKEKGELEVIKATKRPVGEHIFSNHFDNHSFILKKEDLLLLFTDGYADQFGGPRQKKFNYKSLKTLFNNNYQKALNEQKEIYRHTFETWKNDAEQIDDICIMGIRL